MRLVDADKLKISYDGHFVGVAKNDLDNAPTVEAEPIVHGYWECTGSCQVCSVCGEEQYGADTGRYFCQNCGAKMDGDLDNELAHLRRLLQTSDGGTIE